MFRFSSVLNRIKVRLNDTEIRLDYFTVDNERGITLIAKIKRVDYKNEAGGDPPDKPPNAPDGSDENGPAAYSIPVYSTHQITMENVTFYMEEFRIASNGQRVAVAMAGSNTESMLVASEQFYSTINELPELSRSRQRTPDETSEDDDDETEEPEPPRIYRTDALQIARFHGSMDMKMTMKVSDPDHTVVVHNNFYNFNRFSCSKQRTCKDQKYNWSFNWAL